MINTLSGKAGETEICQNKKTATSFPPLADLKEHSEGFVDTADLKKENLYIYIILDVGMHSCPKSYPNSCMDPDIPEAYFTGIKS